MNRPEMELPSGRMGVVELLKMLYEKADIVLSPLLSTSRVNASLSGVTHAVEYAKGRTKQYGSGSPFDLYKVPYDSTGDFKQEGVEGE